MLPLVPHFIQEKFTSKKFFGNFEAACLLVDISGFTAMTETLTQSGKEGVEVLAEILRALFGPLVASVYEQGGFISSFTGDGFIALFPGNADAVGQRALAAAQKIQAHLKTWVEYKSSYGNFTLGVKIGLARGQTEWGIIRASIETAHHVFYFRGASIDQAVSAENTAKSGDIILDKSLYQSLAPIVNVTNVGPFFKIEAITQKLPEPSVIPPLENNPVVAMPFIDKELLRLTAHGESRNVITLFLSLKDINTYEHLEVFLQPVYQLQVQYGGHINKIAFGDKGCNILLFWGAPKGQENDVERALNFMIDLKAITLIPFRAGITYRIVYAGFIGSELRQEYSCYGRGVNLAARQMMSANWGDLWLDQYTARAAERRFRLNLLGQFAFKGFAQELPVYELQGRSDSYQMTLYRGQITGRRAELKALWKFIEPIYAQKFAGIISVYGEAGMGKSRLLEEFKRMATEKGNPPPSWFYCPADEIKRQSLNPFRYFLRAYFNQSNLQSIQQNQQQFDRKIEALILETPDNELKRELERTKSILAALVDIYWKDSLYDLLDPKARFENMMDAIKCLFKAESKIRPVIIELEDSHWLDNDSLQFVDHLTRNIKNFPITIVASIRSITLQKLFNQAIRQHAIQLNGFSEAEIIHFAEEMLSTKIAKNLAAFLLDRTGGNPFFVEQLLYYMQETNLLEKSAHGLMPKQVRGVVVPNDVRAALIARLDRLTQEVKQVVQTASVLGREFELQVLSFMLNQDPALGDKIQAARNEDVWQELTEIRYIFKHALMRDAAYDMQLRSYRLQLHKIAAEAYETVFSDDLLPYYGEIAYHYDLAEIPLKAIGYFQEAGNYAHKNYQNELAIHYYDKLLNALNYKNFIQEKQTVTATNGDPAVTAQVMDMLLLKGDILEHIGKWNEAELAFSYAFSIAKEAHDKARLSSSNARLGWLLYLKGNNPSAMNCYQQQLLLCDELNDLKGKSTAICNIGLIYADSRDYAKAMECFNQTLTLSNSRRDKEGTAQAMTNIGKIYLQRNDYERAMECYERAFILEIELGARLKVSDVFSNMGDIYLRTNAYEKAMKCYERHLTVCEKIGDKRGIAKTVGSMGIIYDKLGDWQKAMRFYEKQFNVCEELGDKRGASQAARNIGLIYETQDKPEQAEHFLHIYRVCSEDLHYDEDLADAHIHLGHVELKKNQYDTALQHYEKSSAIYQKLDKPENEWFGLFGAGRALFNAGQLEPATEKLHKALKVSESIKNSDKICLNCLLLGELYIQQKNFEQAILYLERSLIGFEKNKASLEYNQALLHLGHAYFEQGDTKKAAVYYDQMLTLQVAQKPTDIIKLVLGRLKAHLFTEADTAIRQGFLNQALKNYETVEKHAAAYHNRHMTGEAILNISRVLREKGLYREAVDELKRSFKVFHATKATRDASTALKELADVLAVLNEYDKAIAYYEKILNNPEASAVSDTTAILSSVGDTYLRKGDYEKAFEYYEKNLQAYVQNNDQINLSKTLNKIATIYMKKGKVEWAQTYAKKQIAVGEKLGDPVELLNGYGLMAEIYSLQNDPLNAAAFYEKQIAVCEQTGNTPEIVRILGNLGRAYYKGNDFKRAMDCTKRQMTVSKELNALQPGRAAKTAAG